MQEVGDRLIVLFRPVRSWGAIVFLTFWLSLWTVGGIVAVLHLPKADPGGAAFILLWLCGWIVGECVAAGAIAWRFFGRESLEVTPDELELRQQIGRFSWIRRYNAVFVGDVRSERVPHDEDEQPRRDFGLAISYSDEVVHVGEAMGEREAQYVASVVHSHLRRRSWWEHEERVWSSNEHERAPRPATTFAAGHLQIGAPDPKRAWLIAAAMTACVVIIGVSVVSAFGHHESARPVKQAARSEVFPPSWKDFATPHEYAAAMTSWALNSGRSELVSRPRCDPHSTWTHWSCRALARADWLPDSAGLAVPYRCESAGTGVKCGLAMRGPPTTVP
jgi:hypothetical protein